MGRKILRKNAIANKTPWMLAEWNYCVNPDPNTVSINSSTKYLWTCMFCGDSWEAKPSCHRKPGCSKCQSLLTSRRQSTPKNGGSLADVFPHLALEWDDEQNDRTPKEVSAHARYLAHWICPDCGNHYESYVYSRTGSGSKCPECKKKTLSEKNSKPKPGTSLYEVNRELAEEFHPTKNGDLTAKDVCAYSGQLVWWIGKCGHEFQAYPYHRMHGDGCPICSGKQVLEGYNDLLSNFKDIADEWDKTDPSGYTPRTVTRFSGKKLRWICPTHGPYVMSVAKRTLRGEGCPTCAEEVRNERIAKVGREIRKSHEQFVEEVGKYYPDILVVGTYRDSHHRVLVKCKRCGRYHLKFPGSLIKEGGTGCRHCSSDEHIMPEDEFLARIAISSPDAKLISNYVMASAKMRFKCRKCKCEWVTTGRSVLNGTGCPECHHAASFPETALYYYILKHYPDAQHNVRGILSVSSQLELDIWIPSIRTGIEYDGERWHKIAQSDEKKDYACLMEDVRLIRVREPKCVSLKSTMASIVARKTSSGYSSLNAAIIETLVLLGIDDDDIDTRRDMPKIRMLMPGEDTHLPEEA